MRPEIRAEVDRLVGVLQGSLDSVLEEALNRNERLKMAVSFLYVSDYSAHATVLVGMDRETVNRLALKAAIPGQEKLCREIVEEMSRMPKWSYEVIGLMERIKGLTGEIPTMRLFVYRKKQGKAPPLKMLPAASVPQATLEERDRRFLRSLRIAWDEPHP